MTSIAAASRRNQHLENASQSLLTSSPTISAYLQSIKKSHGTGAHTHSETLTCGSCGSMLLPGWTCKTVPVPSASQRTRQDRLSGRPNRRLLRLECALCHEITINESVKPGKTGKLFKDAPRVKAGSVKASTTEPETSLPTDLAPPARTSPPTTVTNSGVKKRSRGKKSSLQAMLADRKTATQTKGFGLGLEDFMKKPG